MIRTCFLLLISLAGTQASWAQRPSTLDANVLGFYLIQAFQARTSTERLPLNHIGVQVQESASGYLVTAVLEGYPAHDAGINRGDIIESVDGQSYHPVYSFNEPELAAEEFGADSLEHELVVRRGQNTMDLSLQPVFENLYDSYRTATLNSIQEFSVGNKVIGYIRLWGLSRNSNDLLSLSNIIAQLDHCDGLIFDLRNSFGYLDLHHLDLVFTDRSRYFDMAGASGGLTSLASSIGSNMEDPYRKPIAVLVNADTRGGAELFAYQLNKLGRVTTLGTTSAGQQGDYRLELRDSTPVLHYQPANELLIDGLPFEGRGLDPDVRVEYPYQQTTRGDPQYEAAVSILMGTI
ncbi:MAG: S41 family peptidase [Gammaproteobacteria bacterium]|jgi:carboxyl-terminal processing protease|nr:S41 family peptidase [Gammaproteobacteria bacterium]